MRRIPNKDKKGMFLEAWKEHAPKDFADEHPLTGEYPFSKELGRKHRCDFAFIPDRVMVEVDGGSYTAPHGGYHAEDVDKERTNLAAILGWRILRFSPRMIKRDPEGCVALVIRALFYKPGETSIMTEDNYKQQMSFINEQARLEAEAEGEI